MPSVISELSGMINQKLTEVPPSAIRAFDNEISSVPGIIKLTLGEPDFAVPDHVKMAAVKSIAEDDSHYSQSAGKIELREAIAAYLKRTRNVDYDPASEIVVAVGATEALAACTFALLNPGDKVLVPTPVFLCTSRSFPYRSRGRHDQYGSGGFCTDSGTSEKGA